MMYLEMRDLFIANKLIDGAHGDIEIFSKPLFIKDPIF